MLPLIAGHKKTHMTPFKKTKEMRRWDKVLKELAEGLEAQKCTSCGAYPGHFHSDDCSVWSLTINREMIQKAWRQGAMLQNLKLVLWDLVIESRVNTKAPIDVMPYTKRIRQIFDKK